MHNPALPHEGGDHGRKDTGPAFAKDITWNREGQRPPVMSGRRAYVPRVSLLPRNRGSSDASGDQNRIVKPTPTSRGESTPLKSNCQMLSMKPEFK